MNSPTLRFKDNLGHDFPEWQLKSIGSVLSIGSGKDYKHLSTGDVPVYGTGGYMLSVDKYLYDGESVCIGRKGTIDRPVLLNGKFWTVDTLFYTHSFKNCLPKFIYAAFQRIDWKNYNEASGVPSLSKSTIEKIEITLPSIAEQTKIANFLTAVDEKIQLLTQKSDLLAQYKKGVMQKIFSQELRFKDDDGLDFPEWETKIMSDIFIEIKEKVGNQDIETYSISAGKGLISQNEKFGRDISGKQNKNYTKLRPYQFTYNKGNSKTYKYGCVYPNLLGKEIAVPNVFISFSPQLPIATNFYAKLFEWHYLDDYLKKIISSSARMDGLLNVNKKDFFKIDIPYPAVKEQTKIANFLTAIDDKITQTQAELAAVKQYKQGLLQQMFV